MDSNERLFGGRIDELDDELGALGGLFNPIFAARDQFANRHLLPPGLNDRDFVNYMR